MQTAYYDSQGFSIVEDSNSETRTADFTNYAQHLYSCSGNTLVVGELTTFFNDHAESIVNLDAQIKYYILGLMAAYQKALGSQIKLPTDALLQYYHALVEQQFIETLKKHYKQQTGFDLPAINRDLDKLAAKIQTRIAKHPEVRKLPKVLPSQLKHCLETTAVHPAGFKINQGKYTLTCSADTAHNTDGSSAAIAYSHGANRNQKTWIRTPLIVPKKAKDRYDKTKAIIKDCVTKLDQTPGPIFYHLLTSYHKGLGRIFLDGSNQQSTRMIALTKIQDTWNGQNTQKFYPIFLPVNGYGEEIRSNSRDKNIQSMAWRNNLAFIQMLGTDDKKRKAQEAYQGYLNGTLASPAEKLQRIIQKLSVTSPSALDTDTQIKNLLINIVKNNYHQTHMHEFAKMIQALSLYLNANRAMVGCKSGNERTAMIFHRLNAIIDGVQIPTGDSLSNIQQFNKDLDNLINDKHCAGFADFISLHDQHAVPKIGRRKGIFPNTNNAESSQLTNLFTKSSSGMQAHKDKRGLSALSNPSRPSVFRARSLVLGSLGLLALATMTVFFPFLLPVTLPLAANIAIGVGLTIMAALGLKKFTGKAMQSGYLPSNLTSEVQSPSIADSRDTHQVLQEKLPSQRDFAEDVHLESSTEASLSTSSASSKQNIQDTSASVVQEEQIDRRGPKI